MGEPDDNPHEGTISVIGDINEEIEVTFEIDGSAAGTRFVRLSLQEARALAGALTVIADLTEAGGYMRSAIECEQVLNNVGHAPK